MNYGDPAGDTLELSVKVLPAVDRSLEPDPVFFLAGGPGQAASQVWGLLSSALREVNLTRDVVLVDQRGTGDSNPLQCESDDEMAVVSIERSIELVRACLETLDGDLGFFTTREAVEDLERIRQELGFGQVNLLGVSYGTRVAQRWAKAYPDSIRTMILDGVVPLDFAVGEAVSLDADRALDLLIERCKSDTSCAAAFPDLKERFFTLLAELGEEPRSLEVNDPTTGEASRLTVGASDLAMIVRLLTYSAETAALVPLMMDESIRGKPENLIALGAVAGDSLESLYQGMFYSVLCAEDMPFIEIDRVVQEAQGTYLKGSALMDFSAICEAWPSVAMNEEHREPLNSDIPTLLFSGEADPVTPPRYGEHVATGLSASLHLVAPTMGHNVVIRGCAPELVQQFLDQGGVDEVDGSCLQEIRAMPFFVNQTGPAP
jgi:pimeloyl-ACP methyl ester carboxylesterase